MPKFLIEVPHESDQLACARVVQTFLTTGSHYMTRADWGCMDGEHKAWMVVEVDNKDQARSILPPVFRSQAKIVALNTFDLEQIKGYISKHT